MRPTRWLCFLSLIFSLSLAQGAIPQASKDEPLIAAAKKGVLIETERLLKQGANIEVRDWKGFTPILWAAVRDHADLVDFLATHGANVNVRSVESWTALMWAATRGRPLCVEKLIVHGAEVN